MAAEQELVLEERRGPVLVLTLNRPARMNAWTDALEDRYFALLAAAEADPEVRAIVVTGAGRAFCAGADFEQLGDLSAGADASAVLERPAPRGFPGTLRKPLIGAINGAAVGLGLVEALYCDVRFCSPGAKLATAFARRGLVAEYGVSWLLARLVGTSRALDLLLSGRFVAAEEAFRIGLVDRLVPADELLEAAVAYATEIAEECSPRSVAVIKRQVYDDLARDYDQAVARADRLMLESFASADFAEGVASFVERRPPTFPPLPPRS